VRGARLVALAGALVAARAAHADPDPAPAGDAEPQDQVEPAPAAPHDDAPQQKKFYFRVGVGYVAPIVSSSPAELANVDGPASLAVMNGPIAGSGADVSSSALPMIILGYRLPYFHHHLSIETILGTPLTVKFTATGTLANQSLAPTALGIPTGVGPLGPELGEAKAIPPVVTAVYSFNPFHQITPYAGAGASVLFAYGAKATNPILTAVAQPDFHISPAPGLVLQGGIDVKVYKRIYARLDAKFILMHADAEMDHVQVATPQLPLFQTVEVGTAKMSMWVDPLIVQLGVGTDF
jgi:outer membrane protein W